MNVRTKEFEHEGAKFTIGALTAKQVEGFFAEGKTAKQTEVVCRSLNNAREMRAPSDPEFTAERLAEETDDETFAKLRDEIFGFNKLELRKAPAGEAPAAESASSKSAAE